MTIFASSSNARTFDYQAGDVGFVPASSGMLSESTVQGTCRRLLTLVVNLGHYVENIGNTSLHYLEIFNTGEYLIPFAFDHPFCPNGRRRPFPGY
jgi:oxalate decarboxylase/phosphoglucose isomerase-like protein (cupin superfamily)